jgi:hypothetical protein
MSSPSTLKMEKENSPEEPPEDHIFKHLPSEES